MVQSRAVRRGGTPRDRAALPGTYCNWIADATILAAVKHLMSEGTYAKILGKWGVQGGAISDPAINAAIS